MTLSNFLHTKEKIKKKEIFTVCAIIEDFNRTKTKQEKKVIFKFICLFTLDLLFKQSK